VTNDVQYREVRPVENAPPALWDVVDLRQGPLDRPRLCIDRLTISAGVTMVVGSSGAGKTTLLNLLVGFELPTRGVVHRTFPQSPWVPATQPDSATANRVAAGGVAADGKWPGGMSTTPTSTSTEQHNVERHQSLLPSPQQHCESKVSATRAAIPLFWGPFDGGLWPMLTVEQHLQAVAPSTVGPQQIEGTLHQFGLQQRAHADIAQLSAGERARLVLARALLADAQVLVLDEPLAHLDRPWQDRMWSQLRQFAATPGRSLVFSTHDPEAAISWVSQLVCLVDGRVAAAGAASELYQHPTIPAVAELLGPVNWFDSSTSPRWTVKAADGAVRPTALQVMPAASSDICCVSAWPQGCLERLELQHVPTGTCRTVWQCPPSDVPLTGLRVELHLRSAHEIPSAASRAWPLSPATTTPSPASTATRSSSPRPWQASSVSARLGLWFSLLGLWAALSGCDHWETHPPLTVVSESAWNLPPDGSRAPAPRSVTASPDGELYVLDTAGRVLVFNGQGTLLRQWAMPESSVGKPERLLVCRDGRLVVADTHYHRVVTFSRTGEVQGMFGSHGTGPGQFIYPVAVAEDDEGVLYVCEYGGHDRVQKFHSDGTYLGEFGSFGIAPGQFQRPSGILWLNQRIYVVDAFNNRVQVFEDSGKLIEDGFAAGSDAVSLHYPYDLALTPAGEFMIVEYGSGRVTCLTKSGRLKGRHGAIGHGSGEFFTPWGLAVDSSGAVFVADTGNRRVVKLEFQGIHTLPGEESPHF
jgi:iron(III) transport system ATP-binding protein